MRKQEKTIKRARTKGVMVRMKVSTIDYLKGKTDEEAPTVPAAARRIIEQKRREDEAKQAGG